MQKMIAILLVAVLTLPLLVGCFVHEQTIGSGPHSGTVETHYQWYAIWGFLPIGDKRDAGQIAGTTNCKITTKFDVLDVIMALTIPGFGGLGATRRTIIIEK